MFQIKREMFYVPPANLPALKTEDFMNVVLK